MSRIYQIGILRASGIYHFGFRPAQGTMLPIWYDEPAEGSTRGRWPNAGTAREDDQHFAASNIASGKQQTEADEGMGTAPCTRAGNDARGAHLWAGGRKHAADRRAINRQRDSRSTDESLVADSSRRYLQNPVR